jgi:acid stress-induced BolA-like protein IbaG/YrbA
MRKKELEAVLTRRLSLSDPRFKLEKVGTRLVGHVISDSFKGLSDIQRLDKVWDALEAEWGHDSVRRVGTLLLYTNDEWNLDLFPSKKAG